jgi:hypothetical protein
MARLDLNRHPPFRAKARAAAGGAGGASATGGQTGPVVAQPQSHLAAELPRLCHLGVRGHRQPGKRRRGLPILCGPAGAVQGPSPRGLPTKWGAGARKKRKRVSSRVRFPENRLTDLTEKPLIHGAARHDPRGRPARRTRLDSPHGLQRSWLNANLALPSPRLGCRRCLTPRHPASQSAWHRPKELRHGIA